ncbi:MBL fold metallo-hydrolase [Paenibacillus sp. TH7-28]
MGESNTLIRFWSGLRTIGETIVTVEHGQSRIVFDFGRCFSPAGNKLEHGIAELTDPVSDFLRLGLLPPLDGLYGEKSLLAAGSGLRPAGQSALRPAGQSLLQQAVFISHLHLDHMALMGMIDPSVPVLMSEESLRLYEALEAIGEGVPLASGRMFDSFAYDQPVVCGEISVTPLRVDHDVAGACAFLVETPDVRLLYTGDFRLHGNHPEWTLGMAEVAKRRQVHALIIEGTTLGLTQGGEADGDPASGGGQDAEGSVAERAAAAMRETSGLAVINMYHRHIERVEALCEAAIAVGRTPVLEPDTAFLLRSLSGREGLAVLLETPLEGCVPVSLADINAAPERFALQNSFARSLELLRLRTEAGVYIHSNGAPLGAYDPDYAALRDLLRRIGLNYRYIGASGHATPKHLRLIGDRIGADWFIPLHSLHPEQMELSSGIRLLPEYGKTYCFENGKLIGQKGQEG